MKVRTVSTVTATYGGRLVDALPVIESAGPKAMPGGYLSDPLIVEESADGIPVRYVTDAVVLNSVGQPVAATPVTGGASIPIAPAIDQPIITSGEGGPVFATQTRHTSKRLTPGDNNTAVDVNGDTKFRYPGVPAGVIVPSGASIAQTETQLIPGGALQSRRWDMQLEFKTASKFVAIISSGSGTSQRWLAIVNGKWLFPDAFNSVSANGSTSHMLWEFPDRTERTIKLVWTGGNRLVGVDTELAYPPVRSASAGKTLVTIGDSLSAGAQGNPPGGASAVDTWPQGLATLLGFDHCCNASIGGTKWVAGGAGDVAVSHFGGGRLPPALTLSPEAIAFAGSRNDGSGNQTQLDAITAAVQQALDDSAAVPKRFVMGTFTVLPQSAAVQAGAAAKSVPYIDMQNGLQPADIGADTVHPTYQGQLNLRARMAPRLRADGCVPA